MGSYTELMMDKINESHTWLVLENDIEIYCVMPTLVYMEIQPAFFWTNYLQPFKDIFTKIHIKSQALCVEKAGEHHLC